MISAVKNTSILPIISTETQNKHILLKTEYLRANQTDFVSKDLHNTVMNRYRLRNTFIYDKMERSIKKNIRNKKNYWINFLRKIKKTNFKNLSEIRVTDHKKFWKTKKSLIWKK